MHENRIFAISSKNRRVTTVLKQQLVASGEKRHTLVLTGLPPEFLFPADFVHIPEPGYTRQYQIK